jgi:uncharacterized Zn finger protein
VDLQIARSEVRAMVSGSELYTVQVDIAPASAKRWNAICRDCAGSIDSLVDLLQGRLSERVMERVCREGDGLFPAPREINLSCSCPDWADMCKHVAAVLYGIGARLDSSPELLFKLREVDENELWRRRSAHVPEAPAPAGSTRCSMKAMRPPCSGSRWPSRPGQVCRRERQPAKKRSRRPNGRAGAQVAAGKKSDARRAPIDPPRSPGEVGRRKSRRQAKTA